MEKLFCSWLSSTTDSNIRAFLLLKNQYAHTRTQINKEKQEIYNQETHEKSNKHELCGFSFHSHTGTHITLPDVHFTIWYFAKYWWQKQ